MAVGTKKFEVFILHDLCCEVFSLFLLDDLFIYLVFTYYFDLQAKVDWGLT